MPFPGEGPSAERFRDYIRRAVDNRPVPVRLVHPGTTLWAERPEFQTICQELELTAVAPPRNVLSLFGNRLNLLSEAREIGIDHLIVQFDPLASVREVRHFADVHRRYPFVLKSVRGDGDLTVFVVHSQEDIERRLPLWLEQLQRNVGQSILVPERYIESSRFIVAPFARLQNGTFRAFSLVDASLQSGFKRLIEFCPAESIEPALEKKIQRWTRDLAIHSRFAGVGSLYYLVDGVGAYLVGGVARLESEFHLWESIDGVSGVAWQIAALKGVDEPEGMADSGQFAEGREDGEPLHKVALVARLFAEDPLLRLPQPGVVKDLPEDREFSAQGWRSRLSLGVQRGEQVSGKFDALENGLLGSLWVGGTNRRKILEGAREALARNWIAGTLQTNERYLSELLGHPFVRFGHFHAGFVDEEFLPPLRPSADLQRLFATIGLLLAPQESPENGQALPWRWAVGNALSTPNPSSIQWIQGPTLLDEGHGRKALTGLARTENGGGLRIGAYPMGDSRWQVRIGLWWQTVRRLGPPSERTEKASRPSPRKLSALSSGRVHSIRFREGTVVAPHDALVVVESLRILVPHAIPRAGRIERWFVKPGQLVSAGDDLAEITLLG